MTTHLLHILEKRMREGAVQRHTALGSEEWMVAEKDMVPEIVRFFRDDPDAALDLLLDMTCVDHREALDVTPPRTGDSEEKPARFEVIYRLRSTRLSYRLLLSTFVAEDDPVVPSLVGVYPSALWLERELWDLFGIRPEGHPDLRRIITYGSFAGHPLRRDYPAQKSQPLIPIIESNQEEPA